MDVSRREVPRSDIGATLGNAPCKDAIEGNYNTRKLIYFEYIYKTRLQSLCLLGRCINAALLLDKIHASCAFSNEQKF